MSPDTANASRRGRRRVEVRVLARGLHVGDCLPCSGPVAGDGRGEDASMGRRVGRDSITGGDPQLSQLVEQRRGACDVAFQRGIDAASGSAHRRHG